MTDYPALPFSVAGICGPIEVRVSAEPLMVSGRESFGLWHCGQRTITIDGTEPMAKQWHSLFHELTHALLADTGVENLFEEREIEAICDASATARIVELGWAA